MKTIGLLGGTSWASTPLFYNALNRLVNERQGGFHSAEIILRSIDYHDIKTCYAISDWHKINRLLGERLKQLDMLNPDCMIICNNTLHKSYDMIKTDLNLKAPVIHIVEETAREAQKLGMKKLLLMGTRFSMEDGFFARHLQTCGIDVDIPNSADRNIIQSIQTPLSHGQTDPSFNQAFKDMLKNYQEYDGLILACTELPLAITKSETELPILNTIDITCRAAINFALPAA